MQKLYIVIATLSALIANALGAFGTHALKGKLAESSLVIFQTGIQYQFYHSLALLFTALLLFHIKNQWIIAAGIAFVSGIILFSGSLYILSITGIKWLGIITPLGGLSFLFAWGMLLIGALKTRFAA
ncbi:DUF423 domain-containing protein [Legionella fallonii]|uniref:DUF423 domain-containing protein n=1 Tax=Legionella fallonii LLAP-10 TaxID=1212491 RepID=A0A098G8D7_9GAMM|nr:DUF423 domain-containing protein [Legionella fallonii]CEG57735.1 conserved membrane protein of unknown function [Legionella fallonii LLAP-10]